MPFALLGVVVAAVCSGTATVLQARAARAEPTRTGLDAGLLVRLLRHPLYLLALVLVVIAFGLSFLALQTLPLFVVQAGRASSLAVAALLAVAVLRAALSRSEMLAVVAVVAGVVLLGSAAGSDRSDVVPEGTRVGLLVGLVAVAALAALASRIRPPTRAGLALGALAGLSFAVLALGARILRPGEPLSLLTDPAAWAVAGGGALGLLLAAMALQRASVVGATASMVAVETVVGATLGMVLCGDRPAAGGAVASGIGFALVLVGSLSLARFGAADGLEAPPVPAADLAR